MSRNNIKNLKNRQVIEESEVVEVVDETSSEDDNLEKVRSTHIVNKPKKYVEVEAIPIKTKSNNKKLDIIPEKRVVSQAKLDSMTRAREARQLKLSIDREKTDGQKKLIAQIYEKQVEQNLKKTCIPKYEKQIKKQILTRLKDAKLKEMKAQYGIQDEEPEYEESSDEESSEEEVVYTKKKVIKKKPTPRPPQAPAAVCKPVKHNPPPQTPTSRPMSIKQLYAEFGF